MNKKLFSWKALAGLALLVAVGLTSCKQANEVDPENPTSKPVKPGTSTAGDADLTFTITNAKGGDLNTLWNTWKKENADAAKELQAEEEVTIALDFTNYKLDGTEIALPKFLTTTNGSIINIIVSGFAEAKKAFNLSVKNLPGAEVNITLLATGFDMVLDAQGAKVTLDGDAELSTLKATADNAKKTALTIDETVTVAGINMGGALVATADNILAKLVSGAEDLVDGKGALVGDKDNGAVYVKNLIITAAGASVNNAAKAPLDLIVLKEGADVTLGAKKSEIEAIIGLGDITKAAKQNTVTFAGDKDDFSKIGSLTNVILSSGTATNVEDFDIFDGVIFDMPVNLYTDAADTEFKKAVNIKLEDDTDLEFANVDFAKTAKITVEGTTEVYGKKSLLNMFQIDLTTKKYAEVKNMDDNNLTAANAKGTYAKYVTNEPTLNTWKKIDNAGISVSDKFHILTIEKEEKALSDAWEDYDAYAKENGYAKANDPANGVRNPLVAAWEKLNGTGETIKDQDDKKNAIRLEFTADPTATDGDYYIYAKALAFVAAANAAIDGSDWFEIYYADKETETPDYAEIIFDGDCTLSDKALDVDKLNDLINQNFSKSNKAWFDVTYDGTTYDWKYTSKTAYLVEP